MMNYSNSLLFREAGSLINRPVTFCTIARFWHPRTGITAFLLHLSTMNHKSETVRIRLRELEAFMRWVVSATL
jgi:hypothetical protein